MATLNTSAVKVHQPECLDDFALQQNSRYKLESILDQTLPFPANGVCGIVLYGLYGTGKTTIANLLPGLIDTSKADPNAANLPPSRFVTHRDPLLITTPAPKAKTEPS